MWLPWNLIWALQYFYIDIKDGELSEKARTPAEYRENKRFFHLTRMLLSV